MAKAIYKEKNFTSEGYEIKVKLGVTLFWDFIEVNEDIEVAICVNSTADEWLGCIVVSQTEEIRTIINSRYNKLADIYKTALDNAGAMIDPICWADIMNFIEENNREFW